MPAQLPLAPGVVVSIAPGDLGPADAERYRAIIDGDPARSGCRPVPPAEVERIRGLLFAARRLLVSLDRPLLHEIDTLGHEVVLAVGRDGRVSEEPPSCSRGAPSSSTPRGCRIASP